RHQFHANAIERKDDEHAAEENEDRGLLETHRRLHLRFHLPGGQSALPGWGTDTMARPSSVATGQMVVASISSLSSSLPWRGGSSAAGWRACWSFSGNTCQRFGRNAIRPFAPAGCSTGSSISTRSRAPPTS